VRALATVLTLAAWATSRAAAPPARTLDATLARLARVAELYRDSALGFACQETIVATGASTRRIQFAYIFIKDENGRLRDFRTWKTGTTAKERGQEVDPRDYKVPRYLASAYLWAFVFRADRQPLYRFALLGDDTALDRPAVKILFLPRPPVRKGLNDWAGFAWVDRDTSQILKFESYPPADWNIKIRRDADLAAAASRDPHDEGGPYLIDRIVTEFGFAKNRMRFPSHVEMTTSQSTVLYGRADDALRERVLVRERGRSAAGDALAPSTEGEALASPSCELSTVNCRLPRNTRSCSRNSRTRSTRRCGS
jgi:hypothetical protein